MTKELARYVEWMVQIERRVAALEAIFGIQETPLAVRAADRGQPALRDAEGEPSGLSGASDAGPGERDLWLKGLDIPGPPAASPHREAVTLTDPAQRADDGTEIAIRY